MSINSWDVNRAYFLHNVGHAVAKDATLKGAPAFVTRAMDLLTDRVVEARNPEALNIFEQALLAYVDNSEFAPYLAAVDVLTAEALGYPMAMDSVLDDALTA